MALHTEERTANVRDLPTEPERAQLRRLRRLLEAADDQPLKVVGADGEEALLPPALIRDVRTLVLAVADNRPVALVPGELVLPTEQAADLLNVSHTYFLGLLDAGQIPTTTSHGIAQRVRLDDLMSYKRRRDEERSAALDRLIQLHEELGGYHGQ